MQFPRQFARWADVLLLGSPSTQSALRKQIQIKNIKDDLGNLVDVNQARTIRIIFLSSFSSALSPATSLAIRHVTLDGLY